MKYVKIIYNMIGWLSYLSIVYHKKGGLSNGK